MISRTQNLTCGTVGCGLSLDRIRFDYARDMAAIRAAGIDSTEVDRIDLLHMRDPDGISVQMVEATNTVDCPNGLGLSPCEPVLPR